MKWKAELKLAAEAAQAGAALLLNSFASNAQIQSQTGKDIKTRADVESEVCIAQRLSPSGIPVLGEEMAKAPVEKLGLRWLVDPLDGTMNFSRGFPMNAVSVGLWDGNTPILGAVYDLSRRVLYTGCVGAGAWRDGRVMRVSSTVERGQAVLATGFPVARDYAKEALTGFVERVQAFKKIRMIGSAVMSLAFVAEGVFDAYFEEDIMVWDVAAGLALVAAAGGRIEVRPGSKPYALVATATNGHFDL
jgi:myo-inositol-1(or 4)-monophosphatase